MIFLVNGKFVKAHDAKVSVRDSGFQYGDGFYDILRTHDGIVIDSKLHLQRIKSSAHAMGIPFPWSLDQIQHWIERIIELNTLKEARVKIIITRGVGADDFIQCFKPTIIIFCEKLIIDPAIYKGVAVMTMKLSRAFPEVKTLGLTTMMMAYRVAIPQGAFEAILIDESSYVREGASSNIFMVINDRIITPKNNIFTGLTRRRVINLAQKMNCKVLVKDFKRKELRKADELFLTNRLREVIPIVSLNKKKVGTGIVGPVTQAIMKAYQEYVRKYIAICPRA